MLRLDAVVTASTQQQPKAPMSAAMARARGDPARVFTAAPDLNCAAAAAGPCFRMLLLLLLRTTRSDQGGPGAWWKKPWRRLPEALYEVKRVEMRVCRSRVWENGVPWVVEVPVPLMFKTAPGPSVTGVP